MPEGHTVHRQARELRDCFAGSQVRVSSPQGRFADAAAILDGSTFERTDAHGKHLFAEFPGERWLHVHLGLYGAWTMGSGHAPPPRGAIRVRLESESAWADLRGPTACELVTPAEKAVIHARLGPDPLRRDADPSRAWARISTIGTPIGVLLMDQQVLAGVGNVFRAEVLYRARIDPHRPGRAVSLAEWEQLWTDLRGLMRAGVRAGRIVTTRPADRPRRRQRHPEDSHYVYRRTDQPCRICGTPVVTEVAAGRNLYFCPTCQRA